MRRLYTQSLQDFRLADILNEVLAIPRDNHIQLPGSVGSLAKAVANIEGVARTLDPKLPMMEVAKPLLKEAVQKRFAGKDSLQAAGYSSLYNLQSWSAIPERLITMLDQLERSELGLQWHWPQQKEFQQVFSQGTRRIALALMAAGFTLSGARLIAAHSQAESTVLSVYSIWGNLLVGLGLGVAAWLVVLLIRDR